MDRGREGKGGCGVWNTIVVIVVLRDIILSRYARREKLSEILW